jgi:hypothetical protein
MHLESMLHMAQDPERGAGEFVAVGQRLVQKPASYLALEEAFQLYVARRPNEARGVCRRVATHYRERDAEVYKLSVLAEALISELIGDLEAACATLERLGRERGFEADLDRVMALTSLYELIGSSEKLEAAVNICRFLERSFDPGIRRWAPGTAASPARAGRGGYPLRGAAPWPMTASMGSVVCSMALSCSPGRRRRPAHGPPSSRTSCSGPITFRHRRAPARRRRTSTGSSKRRHKCRSSVASLRHAAPAERSRGVAVPARSSADGRMKELGS